MDANVDRSEVFRKIWSDGQFLCWKHFLAEVNIVVVVSQSMDVCENRNATVVFIIAIMRTHIDGRIGSGGLVSIPDCPRGDTENAARSVVRI